MHVCHFQGSMPHTKAQVLSRRVWDILMLLPTNPNLYQGFTDLDGMNGNSLHSLLDPASPQKLIYSLYIVEALVKSIPAKKDVSGKSYQFPEICYGR